MRRLKDPQGGSWGAVQLWLPMERFDDALLLMRRTLGWSMLGAPLSPLSPSLPNAQHLFGAIGRL